MKQVVRRNFDDSVSAYEAYERRTGRFETLARLLAAELRANASGRLGTVIDAGAGTGASTQVFAAGEGTERVVAVDISRAMLRAVDTDQGQPVQADIDRLPFANGAAHAVAFTASLFLVPDPGIAARAAARVLGPEGVVGATAPLGWVTAAGEDIFADLARESRSPTGAEEVRAALGEEFEVTAGTWRFATTAADVRRFHAIPAMAARLYPDLPPAARVERARELLDSLEGTVEQRWLWVVGTPR
ncbi:MAG: SAM-dependent methyltransferase [Salinirussus sp.]|jgi:SAM-dependent methyltransferase